MDRSTPLDMAEEWLVDVLQTSDALPFILATDVDMTASTKLIQRMRTDGFQGSYPHLIARAAALALHRHKDLHVLAGRTKRYYPENINLALSVDNGQFIAPLLLIEKAGEKPLHAMAREITERAEKERSQDLPEAKLLRTWGRLVPRFLRIPILKCFLAPPKIRHKLAGSLIVTCLNRTDLHIPTGQLGTLIVSTGRVRDRVVAENGQAVIRPMVTLCCSIDHRAWNGVQGERFITEMSKILRRGELDAEWPGPA